MPRRISTWAIPSIIWDAWRSMEGRAGNHHRAYKHFMLAARAGYKPSLDELKDGYMDGIVTKDEYANTLRAYQQRYDEMKSDDRNAFRQRRAQPA